MIRINKELFMRLFSNIDRAMKERILFDMDETKREWEEGVDLDKRENSLSSFECSTREVDIDSIDEDELYKDMLLVGEDMGSKHNREAIIKSLDYIERWVENKNNIKGEIVTNPIMCKEEDGGYTLYDGFHRISALKTLSKNKDNERVKELLGRNKKVQNFVEVGVFEVLDISEILTIESSVIIKPIKVKFYKFCDKFRESVNDVEKKKRERVFQTMMENSKHISYEEFKENVEVESDKILDEDETFDSYIEDAIRSEDAEGIAAMRMKDNSNKTIGFFRSKVEGKIMYYFRFAGFEGIFIDNKKFRFKEREALNRNVV